MAQLSPGADGSASTLSRRLRSDSELQGALVRFVVGVVVAAALPIGMTLGYFELATDGYLLFFGYFFGLSALFFVHIWAFPAASRVRPYLSLVFDVTTTTVAVAVSGMSHSPLYPLYIWICITNGVRFGPGPMAAATALSIAMLNGLFVYYGEWYEHIVLAALYSLFLAIFPVYLSGLIRALHRARQAAEAANQAKSEFLANMTHELRTPLVGVVGITSLLWGTRLTDEQRRYVQTLRTSTRTLSQIIDDLLDFSRIEAGRLELDRRPLSLKGVAEEVEAMTAVSARERRLQLRLSIAPGIPTFVLGDELRLRQVLLNLVGNAIKFTERGTIALRLFPVGEEGGRVRVRVEVEDTGIGMTEEQVARIFERFRQGDSSLARRYQGTGLGTSIAKRLVELMGGTIGVESEYGEGSCFWFEIPWMPTNEEPAGRVGGSVTPPQVIGESGCGPLLLVEDNAINVMAIATILEKAGYRVDVAEDAFEALEAKERTDYALVFMDMQLPGMDGPALARRWREQGRGRDTPIVALTANVSTEDRDLCLEAGMCDFLAKPVEAERLVAVAAQYCGGAAGKQDGGGAVAEAGGSR